MPEESIFELVHKSKEQTFTFTKPVLGMESHLYLFGLMS